MKTFIKLIGSGLLGAALVVSFPAAAQDQVVAGKKVFTDNCAACHSLEADVVGPALQGVTERRSEEWIKNFVKNSSKVIQSGDKEAVALFQKYNKVQMPAFASTLNEEQLTSLVAYLKEPVEASIGPPTEVAAVVTPSAPDSAFTLKNAGPLPLILGATLGLLFLLVVIFMVIIGVQIFPVMAKLYTRPEYQNTFMARMVALFQGEAQLLVKKDQNIIMEGHDYDGIHEFDNDLPPWWRYLFYATIFWGAAYLVNFHVLGGKLQEQEYEAEVQMAALLHPPTEAGSINEKTDFTVLTDAAALENGKTAYLQNCAACHGQNAEGKIGPNLTDEYWLHGGDVNEVFKTVKFGVTEKGMVAWNGKLTKDQILEVSSYILSLQGSNPAGAKEPQGEKVGK